MPTNADLQLEVNHLRNTVEAQDREIETLRKQLADAVLVTVAKMTERDKEIEALTTERDNALLRIEELERELDWARPFVEITRPDDKGGVNPNA